MTTTRNKSTKSNGLGRTPVTPSSTVCALMVRIDWTDAKSVTITARQDFILGALTIDTKSGLIVVHVPVKVVAGTTIFFIASSHEGLYYIGRVSPSYSVSCTCPHMQNKRTCKHIETIQAAYAAKEQHAEFAMMYREAVAKLLPPVQVEEVQEEEVLVTDVTNIDLTVATHEERVAYWKALRKREREEKKGRASEYWAKVYELREAS